MRGRDNKCGLFEAVSSIQDCLKPDGRWIKGEITSYFFLKPVNLEKGITVKQANFSRRHPDSLTFVTESREPVYTGPRRLEFLKLQNQDWVTKRGILCIKDGDALNVARKEISSYSKPVLAKDIFIGLFAIILFGTFCALVWPMPDDSAQRNGLHRLMWLIFFIALAIITAKEAYDFFHALSLSLPMPWYQKLSGPNLGFTVGLFLMAAGPFWKGLKDQTVFLGFVAIGETIIFIGLQTGSFTALLVYFCFAGVPFFVINLLPLFFRWKKTPKTSTK
jgi:hypothetical protein